MAQGNVISAPWRYPLHPFLFRVLDIAFADDGTGGSRAADQTCDEECRGDSNGVGRSSIGIDGRCPEGRSRSL